jgi:hypothetical protein
MIECIFTVDYEIYGNGTGSLGELVYGPAARMREIFLRRNVRFVPFVELAELEMIEARGTDPDIDLVKNQIRNFCKEGFELGLHFHPWWYNARYEDGRWVLDYSEYNLCALGEERIAKLLDRSISYLRRVVEIADYSPLSFRAGHLLFQPAGTLARLLAQRDIKVDTSVYKGGVHEQYKVDYRDALKNGYYWRFTDSANVPDPQGVLLELPIYTQMVPTWKLFTGKRVALQQKGSSLQQNGRKMWNRLGDYFRFSRAMKLDFCQMLPNELTQMIGSIIREDEKDPSLLRPVVLIGHTKELADFETVEFLLSYLLERQISVTTFKEIYPKCQ